jgi:hypothetical protein
VGPNRPVTITISRPSTPMAPPITWSRFDAGIQPRADTSRLE